MVAENSRKTVVNIKYHIFFKNIGSSDQAFKNDLCLSNLMSERRESQKGQLVLVL